MLIYIYRRRSIAFDGTRAMSLSLMLAHSDIIILKNVKVEDAIEEMLKEVLEAIPPINSHAITDKV